MNLTLITDATAADEPLQPDQCESYLKLDPGTEPDTLARLITAARLEAENEQGRELARKQWRLSLDFFPLSAWSGDAWWPVITTAYGERAYRIGIAGNAIELLDPLVTVDSFTYKKSDGSTVTLAANVDYIVDTDKHPGVVMPAPGKTWPTEDLWPSGAVKITFTAGYQPAQVPASILQGMQLLISQWYLSRIPFEAIRFVAELPFSVTSLFRNNKLWRF